MQSIYTTDSYEAFKNENGLSIKVKTKGAKKMGVIITVAGLAFIGISFIDTMMFYSDPAPGFAETIQTIFFYTFRYGGITMAAAGLLLLIFKGAKASDGSVEVDKHNGEVRIKKKIIPFVEISDVTTQVQPVLGKTMTMILLNHNGKKRPLLPPAFGKTDAEELNKFVAEVKNTIGLK